jgi:hypothetical protein
MELKEKLKSIAEKAVKQVGQITTEEATKNALIMPFLHSLGYDVFNPEEVIPEYIADIGDKKGEKVDYAVMKDGVITIIVECKKLGEKLDIHTNQLKRYFTTVDAKFGILTNGITYQFYSDFDNQNLMDSDPFLEIDITDIKDNEVVELRNFYKTNFNTEQVWNSARSLKFESKLIVELKKELTNPSVDFVRLLAGKFYKTKFSQTSTTAFTEMTKKVIQLHLKESPLLKADQENAAENKTVTTEEELEAFTIIKTLLRQKISASRITHKDTQNYFGILIDENSRNTVCRLFFNGGTKYIVFIDNNKNEIKKDITCLEDIFNHTDILFKTVEKFV